MVVSEELGGLAVMLTTWFVSSEPHSDALESVIGGASIVCTGSFCKAVTAVCILDKGPLDVQC